MEEQTSSPVPKQVVKPKEYSFYGALELALSGLKITKLEWDNKDIYGFFDGDLLKLHLADGKIHNWILQRADVEGTDWIEIQETN